MVANKMAHELDPQEWKIVIVDRHESHYYQPGFLFIPFGIYNANDVTKRKRDFIPANVDLIFSDIERIEPERSRVLLTQENKSISYDILVIATGTQIHPEETEGLGLAF